MIESSRLVRAGTHLRLGNVHHGHIVLSDDGRLSGTRARAVEGHVEQPYATDEGLFYTHESEIWRDRVKLIGRFDGYDEVCHPTVDGRWLYFEAKRVDPQFPGSAKDWQVLRYHLDSAEIELILVHGANPYVHDGRLFHSRWSDRKGGFETVAIPIPAALPQRGLRGAA